MNKDIRRIVFERDGGCMAPVLDPGSGFCGFEGMRDSLRATLRHRPEWLEYNHITQAYGQMGKRAEDRVDQGITLCGHHHRGGWGTSKAAKAIIREHLARLYPGRSAGRDPGRRGGSDVVRRVRTAEDDR